MVQISYAAALDCGSSDEPRRGGGSAPRCLLRQAAAGLPQAPAGHLLLSVLVELRKLLVCTNVY